jgi:tetratricopeptide (TPR) repeat protein
VSLHFLADTHRRLARVQSARGQRDAALAEYRESIRLHEERLVRAPDSTLGDDERALAYFEYAQLLSQVGGRAAEARAHYEKGLAIEPKTARDFNSLAWFFATAPDPILRDPARAVRLARRSVELVPNSSNFWNTLGTALYRAADWPGAIEALRKSNELEPWSHLGLNGYVLAMAHLRRGEFQPARIWFDVARRWHRRSAPGDEELERFRAEAARVLGLAPEADREDGGGPGDDSTLARLVLRADPAAAWARARLGTADPGHEPTAGPTCEATMPNGLEAFARD